MTASWRSSRRRHPGATIAGLAAALVLLALATDRGACPRLVLNLSPSVPTGFYVVASRPIRRHALVLVRLPERTATLAARRGYLPPRARLLKPIAARAGDSVCRIGGRLSINRRLAAIARASDEAGRGLPRWQGCRRLAADELLVLSPAPNSFDGRYFGPLSRASVCGIARARGCRRASPIKACKRAR